MQDSPMKRIGERTIARRKGEHVSILAILEGLEHSVEEPLEMEIKALELLEKYLQLCADFLRDTTRSPHSGERVASLGLLNGCIDELLVAGHLVKHRFYTQAAPHFRNVYESLNLVEAFHLSPDLVYVWVGEDKKEKQAKLSPSNVRKLLNKDFKNKEIFDFLSEVGSHPGFEALQSRLFVEAGKGEERQKLKLFLGGSPIKNQMIYGLAHLLVSVQFLMSSIIDHFGSFLLFQEYFPVLKEFDEAVHQWFEKYSHPFADEIGMDPEKKRLFLEDLGKARAKVKEMSDEIEKRISEGGISEIT